MVSHFALSINASNEIAQHAGISRKSILRTSLRSSSGSQVAGASGEGTWVRTGEAPPAASLPSPDSDFSDVPMVVAVVIVVVAAASHSGFGLCYPQLGETR